LKICEIAQFFAFCILNFVTPSLGLAQKAISLAVQIRNPKLKIRNKFKNRNRKYAKRATSKLWTFLLLNFEFVWDFEFRISDLRG